MLDGGDVLFVPLRSYYENPGNQDSTLWKGDLFVGLSARTNEQGAQVLRNAFKSQGVDVHCVPLGLPNTLEHDTLHLKSVTTALAPSTLVVGMNE